MIRLAMVLCLMGALLAAPAAFRALNGSREGSTHDRPATSRETASPVKSPAKLAPKPRAHPRLVDSHHTRQPQTAQKERSKHDD